MNNKIKNIKNYLYSNQFRWFIDHSFFLIFLIATLLSSSFIFLVVGVIIQRGITPFVTDNFGLGATNIWSFLTGDIYLTGSTFYSSQYEIGYLIVSTLYNAFLALLLAFPIGVATALFIAKIAPKWLANILRTVIEILSSIPSIVFGLFGAVLILDQVYLFTESIGFQSRAGLSVLSTVILLSIMIIPTITAISEVAIRSVDQSIEQGALALGATVTQKNFKVVLASAKSGIFSSAILGVGRALGEATAVSLVSGSRFSGYSFNIFDTTATLTSKMLEGMKETQGVDYSIRFSIGLALMVVILLTNFGLNFVKNRIGKVSGQS
jgi:phosphate transport system permease protein